MSTRKHRCSWCSKPVGDAFVLRVDAKEIAHYFHADCHKEHCAFVAALGKGAHV